MFTLLSKIPIHPSSQRLTRPLVISLTLPSSIRQSHQSTNQYLFNLHTWKLTHQPREPTLHWNPRFRQQRQLQIDTEETNQSNENWDSWFEKHQSPTLLPYSHKINLLSEDKVYFLNTALPEPMPKRPRESSTNVDISYKREKHVETEFHLPKRSWSHTNYEKHVEKSRFHHFNFHIISYNILAQKLIEDNPFLYEDCSESHLSWNRRKQRLLKEILKQNADIICLQEMQNEHYRNDFLPKMNDHGYDSIYIKRSGDKADGCCLFYRADRLKLVDGKTVPFYRRDIALLDRDNCGLIALFQPKTRHATSNDLFCVATTHLLFSPKRGDIKLAQIQYFLAEIDRLSRKDSMTNAYHPIIICGDLNAQPQSPLSKFLINGHIKYDSYRSIEISGQIPQSIVQNRFSLQLPSNALLPSSFVTSNCSFPRSISSADRNQLIYHAYASRHSSAELTHNKHFHSVYDLDNSFDVTTCINNEKNFVDYIFYTRQEHDRHRLNLLSRYDLYTQNQMFNLHLPNQQFPSDHFLLAARFALKLNKKKH